MSRQKAMAAAVLIAWIAVGAWQWSMSDGPKRVPLVNTSRSVPNPGGGESISEWTLLKPPPVTRQIPSVPKRNLFAPVAEHRQHSVLSSGARIKRVEHQERPELPLPGPVDTNPPVSVPPIDPAVHRLSAQEQADQARHSERERRQKQLADQFAQYRLLGVVDRGGIKQAFVGKGADIYIVRQGDLLGDMFFVSLVDASGVKVRDVENRLEHTLQLKTEGRSAS